MGTNDSIKIRRSLMAVILTTLLISGTAVTAASSYTTGPVYAQQQRATVNVVLKVVCNPPAPAACPSPSQFQIQVTGNDPVPNTPFSGSETGRDVTLDPGNFRVNVVGEPSGGGPSGYRLFNDFQDCSGSIAAGERIPCVITSTYFLPSTLKVIKQVQCPEGRVCPQPRDFDIRVSGNPADPSTSFSGSSAGTNVSLGVGNFSVREVSVFAGEAPPNPPGLANAPVLSNSCNGVVPTPTRPGQQLPDCIITNRYLADTDGDGLSDTWETNGIDINNDGRIDFNLPQANTRHKNLYIETDYMQFHRPHGGVSTFGSASVVHNVTRAFAAAPVTNPDGRSGITLVILLNEEIPHENLISFDAFETAIKNKWFGTRAERTDSNAANILAAKRLVYHYALFGHQLTFGNPLGRGNTPGMNFMDSLGSVNSARNPATNHPVGSPYMQTSTFIHEFGHNLGLNHGGNERLDCKTNYLSVMNGLTVEGMYIPHVSVDFSRSALPSLNKGSLIEQNGIGQSVPPNLKTIYNGPAEPLQGPRLANAGMSIDWNFNNITDQEPVSSDINADFLCGIPGPPSATGTINGFNDWGSPLRYVTITGPSNPSLQSAAESELEITSGEIEKAPDGLTILQADEEQAEDEPTYEDVKKARVDLLTGIDHAILRLGGEFNTFLIFEDLQLDQLDAAIAKLLVLKSQVIEEFGEEAANKEVVPLIDNLVGVLEQQKFPTPPPASDCVGTGSRDSRIIGTPDPDTIIGTDGHNIISGLEGDDRINGCGNVDSISGNTGNDGIAGGAARDRLHGDEGDDVIQGDAGDDVIFGDSGINTLTGGPGRDIFFCSPEGETTITDFVPGVDRFSGPCIFPTTTTTTASTAESSTPTTNNLASQDGSTPRTLLSLPLPT
jgi:hypothetical protein